MKKIDLYRYVNKKRINFNKPLAQEENLMVSQARSKKITKMKPQDFKSCKFKEIKEQPDLLT